MSTKRKKTGGNPAKVAAPTTPDALLGQLTHSTAERVLEGLRLLDNLAKDYPNIPHLQNTRVAYEVASIALIEALDEQNGITPYRLTVQEDR